MTIETVADFYSETEVGRELLNRGTERGREEGAASVLQALLKDRFGEHSQIPVLAERLAQLRDQAAAIHAITQAQTIDGLITEAGTAAGS